MKQNLPLVAGLFVFVLTLSGAVYLLNGRDTGARDALGLARAARAELTALEVTKATTTVRIEKAADGWSLDGVPVDTQELTAFLDSVAKGTAQLVARSNRSNPVYGLTNGVTLSFLVGETRTVFEIGSVAYATGGVYVARPGESAVYLVTESDALSRLGVNTFVTWKVGSTSTEQVLGVPAL